MIEEERQGWIWAVATLLAGLLIAFGALGARDDGLSQAGTSSSASIESGANGSSHDQGEPEAEPDADAGAQTGGESGSGADPEAAPDPAPEPVPGPDDGDPEVIPPTGSDSTELDCRVVADTGTTSFTLDPATATALEGAAVGVAAIPPATTSGGEIRFEVLSSSRVSCDAISGFLAHRGGLSFATADRTVDLQRFRINLANGSVVAASGATGGDSIEPFIVETGTGAVSDDSTTFTLGDAQVNLTGDGADAMNRGLGVALFDAGATIGTVTITYDRQPV